MTKISSGGIRCTGFAVSSYTVLTAEHCIRGWAASARWGGKWVSASSVSKHPSEDLAALHFNRAIFPYWPTGPANPHQGAWIYGFGRTANGPSDGYLRRAWHATVSFESSNDNHIRVWGNAQNCTMNGDSGGPIVQGTVVIGVFTHSSGCGKDPGDAGNYSYSSRGVRLTGPDVASFVRISGDWRPSL